MDHVDRASSRVGAASAAGFIAGTASGALRGLPAVRVGLTAAASSAMVATALVVPERLAYVALSRFGEAEGGGRPVMSERRMVLSSHAFGGVVGGGLNGYLYQKKPLRGMFFFIPAMMAIGFAELAWEGRKRERRRERHGDE